MTSINGKNKPFLTYKEQIEKLRNEKKLQIEDEDKAIEMLKRHSYFALVSGYKCPFKKKDGTYQPHTSLDDIYALYSFDNSLRNCILSRILVVEKHVKSLISYSFCEGNGSQQQAYLDATKYDYVPPKQDGINKLLAKLTSIVNDPKDYQYIKHQKELYNNIPLWVMVKALPMGSISKMYSFLQPQVQSKISQEFMYVDEDELARMLDLLSRVRNVCAHNERLYDYMYRKGSIKDSFVHDYLQITKKNGVYQKGKSDLFAVLICLKYLLTEEEIIGLVNEIRHLLDELYKATKRICPDQMRKYMGFPVNWEQIKDCPFHKELSG